MTIDPNKTVTKLTVRQAISVLINEDLSLDGQADALVVSIAKYIGISIDEAEKLSPVKKAAYLSLVKEDLLEQYSDFTKAVGINLKDLVDFCVKHEDYVYIIYSYKVKINTPPVYR
jgi:hypothetical protein